jgi:hypothetical protein
MKRPPSVTYECVPCRETFFTKTGGICTECRQPLTIRPEGAPAYGRPLEDADLALTDADDVVLVK